MLPELSIEMKYRNAESVHIDTAREWLRNYDGLASVRCKPETGSFIGIIGFNVSSGRGARGVTFSVESIRESDTVLGLYLIANHGF